MDLAPGVLVEVHGLTSKLQASMGYDSYEDLNGERGQLLGNLAEWGSNHHGGQLFPIHIMRGSND